jgi:hypothetical protein
MSIICASLMMNFGKPIKAKRMSGICHKKWRPAMMEPRKIWNILSLKRVVLLLEARLAVIFSVFNYNK